jgi:DNA-binding transcriptional LysR family regulator
MAKASASWDFYRSFLAVLNTGSLSAAARSLQLTQPTVGRHIELLQQSLDGRVLFTRSQTGLLPTEAAHELRVHAEAMEAAAAALERTASVDSKKVGGVIRVAAADIIGVEVLPPILSAFKSQHPATVIEASLSNQMSDLLHRDADIAVRMVRPQQKALLAKRAGKVALGIYAHRRYLDQHGTPQKFEDLIQHALIGFDRTLPFGDLLKAFPMPISRELFSFRCDNDLAQLAALRSAFGVGLCQVGIARRDPELVPLLAKQFRVEMEVWIVMHGDLKRTQRMRLMFDHLVNGFAQHAAESARA